MSAKDTYHEIIKNALIKDGWKIIRDPYTIIKETNLLLIVVNLNKQEIVKWIN